jgi:PPP family 3-phenylpropionic acid transporter
MRKIWPFSFNVLFYAGFASAWPYMVPYFQSLGFSGAQIGVLTGITPLIALVSTPLWTSLADATHRHRLVMSVNILVAALAIFTLPYLSFFVPILLFAIVFNIFLAPVTSFADSASMYILGDQKAMYGRIRLGGTLGYAVMALVGGMLVQQNGISWAFWSCGFFFSLAFFVALRLTHNPEKGSDSTWRGIRILMSNPRWLLFLAVAFAGGLAQVASGTYLFAYLGELGAEASIMGLILMVGTLSEIPVLLFSNRLVGRFKPYGLLMVGITITGLRLLAFAASSTPWQAILVQLFNGLTFAVMWIAGVAYADEMAPAGLSATAQGMFGAMVFGVGAAVGGFIGGPLLVSIGGRGLFLVYGVIVLVIVGAVALAQRRL